MPKSKIAGYITVSITCNNIADARDYLDELEDKVHGLAKIYKSARVSTSHASDSKEGWTEVFALQLETLDIAGSVTEDIVAIVRSMGIPKGCSIEMGKREIGDPVDRSFRRKVFINRNTIWQPDGKKFVEKQGAIKLPRRISYLTDIVQQYYQIGGNDVGRIFRSEKSPHDFLEELTTNETDRLVSIYGRIIKSNDHLWVLSWLQENGDGSVSIEKAQVVYFFALLDRLNECGLSGEKRYIELVDWDQLI
ncbi:hypothetical protein Enr10x_57040 [Gimesia panareensis]|uniref:Uncharacterized protein n=1 Tax=Gimesia panareensis TaxID=2527978 RepID=A0A517QFB7_9PLAN|nr:hypothetical protein [Gimesia panareensis]QDT30338.1 hypothetical protein Enr10x_57040 [Gimesia panareensis]